MLGDTWFDNNLKFYLNLILWFVKNKKGHLSYDLFYVLNWLYYYSTGAMLSVKTKREASPNLWLFSTKRTIWMFKATFTSFVIIR